MPDTLPPCPCCHRTGTVFLHSCRLDILGPYRVWCARCHVGAYGKSLEDAEETWRTMFLPVEA